MPSGGRDPDSNSTRQDFSLNESSHVRGNPTKRALARSETQRLSNDKVEKVSFYDGIFS